MANTGTTIAFALVWAASVAWLAVSIVRALFPSKRRSGLRQAGLAAALFISSFAGVIVTNELRLSAEMSEAGVSTREELAAYQAQQRARQAIIAEAAAARAAQEAQERAEEERTRQRLRAEEEQAGKIDEYVQQINRELASVPDFSAKQYIDSTSEITIALALIQAWATILDEGSLLTLPPEGEAVRRSLLLAVMRKQEESLPILRDAFGPAMRKELWESDGKARTFGGGFRTVEFIAADFAANRNIRTAHGAVRGMLMMLRFTRAQYKWVDADVEYSYYDLKGPKDADVVIWSNNGSTWRAAN